MRAPGRGPRWVLAGAALVVACIIPDREIGFAGGPDNEFAVRIVFRPPMTDQMIAICQAPSLPERLYDASFCPAARNVRPAGLIRSADGGPFCICPTGRDARAIPAFTVYAEDADTEHDDPRDTLYGVLLLDPDPEGGSPLHDVAYQNYLEAGAVGVLVDDSVADLLPGEPEGGRQDRTVPTEARDEVFQRRFLIDDPGPDNVLDLCNDDNGTALDPGLHNLQFLVTDRPFFRPVRRDEDGSPAVDPVTGETTPLATQYGVPDLAAGASYAVANYVFECLDATADPAPDCDCEDSI
jgi:hypothetical protein